jgi:cyanophycinase-like exopeptidase
MGSGETSPTMVTPHQQILSAISDFDGKITVLDTPFGFQENADVLTERLSDYFLQSVGVQVTTATLRHKNHSPAQVAGAIAAIRESKWVFAGPGSPSYALSVWQETGLASHLDEVVTSGALVLASAAALTAGAYTIPVYEIYKVGQDSHWLPGLNILEHHTGLKAAVIPHFDNSEGGNHDTRFCYMGERRLRILEARLPADCFILGVDEHTGVSFNIDSKTARVFGRGFMTVRRGDHTWTVASGQEVTFDEIAQHGGVPRTEHPAHESVPHQVQDVEELLETGNVLNAVDVLLELDELDRDLETRATVHALITRLGHLAASPRVDIDSVVGPYIDALLQARQAARAGGRWDEADVIRNRLQELKVTINDSQEGSTWEISST